MAALPPDLDLRLARRRVLLVTLAVAAQLGLLAWHYAAHDRLGVPLAGWHTWFVALVGMLAPFFAVVLMWGRKWRAGALLLGVAVGATLAFDLAQHYWLDGPHHVQAAPEGAWERAYRLTTLFLIATESLALAAASWVLRAEAPRPPTRQMRRRR